MNQRYESRKEYSLMDVLQYNLRKWWLAAVFAAVFAVIVGGYKAKTLMPYIDAEVYDDRMQVETSVLLKDYNSGSTVERGNDIMKIAKSSSVYDEFCKVTGIDLTNRHLRICLSVNRQRHRTLLLFMWCIRERAGIIP